MKARRFMTWTSLLLVCPLALAAAGATKEYGLQDCIDMALASDPDLKMASLDAAIAEAHLWEMKRQFLPALSLQAGYDRLSPVDSTSIPFQVGSQSGSITLPGAGNDAMSISATLSQALFTGGKNRADVEAASASSDASRLELSRFRRELRYSIANLFWSLDKAKREMDNASEGITQAQNRLKDAQTLRGQGRMTDSDVLEAKTYLASAQLALAKARQSYELSRVKLALAVGLPWNAPIEISTQSEAPPRMPSESLDELINAALLSREDILAAHSSISVHVASVVLARSILLPQVYLTGNYTYADPNQRIFSQRDQFDGTWALGLVATLQLGSYPQAFSRIEEERGKLQQAQEGLSRARNDAVSSLVSAYLQLRGDLDRLATLHEETLEAAENNRLTQERFGLGAASTTESSDAQSLLAQAQLNETEALADCRIAEARLAFESGR